MRMKTTYLVAIVSTAVILLMLAAPLGAQTALGSTGGQDNNGATEGRPKVVFGSGTIGYLAKFVGPRFIRNSTIFEDESGNIGIGTTTPSRNLDITGTVAIGAGTPGNNTAVVVINQHSNPPDGGFNVALKVDAAGDTGTGESIAIWGISSGPTSSFGVQGSSSGGAGVFGDCGEGGVGVVGYAPPLTGATRGVLGVVESPEGIGGEFSNHAGGTILRGFGFGGFEAFHVAGDGTVTAADFVETSSAKLKRDVVSVENALGIVERLRGVTYIRKTDGGRELGLIAEEVAQVVPEVVTYNADDEPLGLNYGRLTSVLIEAVKAQQQQIRALRQEVESLRAERP